MRVIRFVLFVIAVFWITTLLYGAQPAPVLSEMQRLTVERHAFAAQLAEARARLAEAEAKFASCTLSNERASIDAELAKMGVRIIWETLTLVAADAEAQKQP